MLVYNVKFLEGTSTKTGKPYAGYAIEGVSLMNNELRNDKAFINAAAYNRCPVHAGDIIEVFRSGEVYQKAVNVFDVSLIREVL